MSNVCPVSVSEQVLAFDLAIVAAAEQNFERDCRMRFQRESCWEEEKLTYFSDAFDFLSGKGVNNAPHYPDHPQILLAPGAEPINFTGRAIAYQEALDGWYNRYNTAWYAGKDFREPKPVAGDFS